MIEAEGEKQTALSSEWPTTLYFQANSVCDESLPQAVQQSLLRIAQEAISNAIRHAKPTVISVSLRLSPPNLVLEVRDNGPA